MKSIFCKRLRDYFFLTHPRGHFGATAATFLTALPFVHVIFIVFFTADGVAIGEAEGDALGTDSLFIGRTTMVGAL